MAKFNAAGATFLWGAAAGAPDTTIGQVISGDVDFGNLNMVDSTTIDNTRKTAIPGTFEPLQINVTVQWDPVTTSVNHDDILTDFLAKTTKAVGVKFANSDASFVYADGNWTSVTSAVAVDDRMQASFSFQSTGAVTYTADTVA